jgi:hypothetical protein
LTNAFVCPDHDILNHFFQVPPQVTTITTAPLPFDPSGTFILQVDVYGGNMAAACGSMNLTSGAAGDWVGAVTPVVPALSSNSNVCTVTWKCMACRIGSSSLNPTFKLSSTMPSWANFYNITLWTPALGGALGKSLFSVNSIFAPTGTLGDAFAFRGRVASGISPTVVFQLTGFTALSGSDSAPERRVAFQPSVTSSTAEPLGGPPLLDASSTTDQQMASQTFVVQGVAVDYNGFNLNFQLNRNSLSIIVSQIRPSILNIVVLIASLAGSVISALAVVFTQLENFLKRKSLMRDHSAETDQSHLQASDAPTPGTSSAQKSINIEMSETIPISAMEQEIAGLKQKLVEFGNRSARTELLVQQLLEKRS